MVDYPLLSRELADLAAGLGPDTDLHDGLFRLTLAATAGVGITGAGVTVQIPGRTTNFVTAVDDTTLHVERRQDEFGEGGCIDAISRSEPVAVRDLEATRPWPRLTPVLLDAGFRAAASVPIRFRGNNIGAVDLYADSVRPWAPPELTAATLIADVAAGYLVNNELLRETETLAEQLQLALDSRVIIEQAKGVLAGRHGVTPEVAFARLRTHARTNRLRLHELAHAVVVEGLDPVADFGAAADH